MKKILLITLNYLLLFFSTSLFASKSSDKCVYVSSYHVGYSWSDGIEKEIKKVLKGHCEIIQYNMDTKRNKDIAYIKRKALEIKNLIDKIKPKVIITSDDNAAKFLIKPYFNNTNTPIVFSGINWTAKEYEFSYSNITGMIEIIPIKQLYKVAKNLTKGSKGIFIGDDTITDRKDLAHFSKLAKKDLINLDSTLVNTSKEWKEIYLKAQDEYDFIILGHNSAIKNWDDKDIKNFLSKNSNKLVLTTYSWMMPYSMVGLIIKAKEQGNWAATTAKAILNGFPIENISITTNKSWQNVVNTELLDLADIKLPRDLLIKSKKIDWK